MSILKLANAGDEATLTITGCEVVEGQYGEQVQFDDGEDRLYLPKTSADRQLERIYPNFDFNYEHLIGEVLTFSRTASTKPGAKPFWNINTAKKANGAKPVAQLGGLQKASTTQPPVVYASSKPESELPPFLQTEFADEAAELAAKIGEVPTGLDRKAAIAWAQKQSLAIVLNVYEPMFVEKNIGLSDETVHKLSFELFKTWSDKGLVG